LLQKTLDKKVSDYYWNSTTDKALLLSFIMKYDTEKQFETYIDEQVDALYAQDWSNYYFSTKTKNSVFRAFAQYIEKE
jgi:hypothetical protein